MNDETKLPNQVICSHYKAATRRTDSESAMYIVLLMASIPLPLTSARELHSAFPRPALRPIRLYRYSTRTDFD